MKNPAKSPRCCGLLLALVPVGSSPPAEDPSLEVLFHDAWRAMEAGELAAAAAGLETCAERDGEAAKPAFYRACVAGLAGEAETALAWLARAVERGWTEADVALAAPELAALRADERFGALVAAMRTAAGRERESESRALTWRGGLVLPEISPDGERLVTRSRGGALLVDVATGATLRALGDPADGTSAARITAGGLLVVTSHPRRHFRVWDGRTGELLRELEVPDRQLLGHFDLDERGRRLLAVTWPHDMGWSGPRPIFDRAHLFDLGTGESLLELPGYARSSVALSPDGSRALTVADYSDRREPPTGRVARLWDLARGGEVLLELDGLGRPMYQASFSPDGARGLVAGGGAVHVVDAHRGEVLTRLGGADEPIGRVWFTADPDELVTMAGEGLLRWWSVSRGEVERELATDDQWGSASAAAEVLLLRGPDRELRVRDLRTGELLWERAEPGRFAEARLSVDGRRILVTPAGVETEILAARTGLLLHRVPERFVRAGAPAVRPGGTTLAVPCSDGTVRFLDLATGRAERTLRVHDEALTDARWASGGRRLVAAGLGGDVVVLDAETGARRALPAYGTVRGEDSFAVSPDGSRLLTWDGPSARIWDLASGAELARHDATSGEARVHAAAWSPDGRRIAVIARLAYREYKLRLWTVAGEGAASEPLAVGGIPMCVAFDGDGRLLVGTLEGRVVLLGADGALLWERQTTGVARPDVREVGMSPDGARIVATTGEVGQVFAWDAATGELAWSFGYSGGTMHALHARPDPSGERLLVFGQTRHTARIVDVRDGTVVADLGELGIGTLGASSDGRYVLGDAWGGVLVLDGRTHEPLYTWIPGRDGAQLTVTAQGYWAGSARLASEVRTTVEGEPRPLDTWAWQLHDPIRVRAVAVGAAVATPRLETPPTLSAVMPAERVVQVGAESLELEAVAEHPGGLAGFSVETLDPDTLEGDSRLPETWTRVEESDGIAMRLLLRVPPESLTEPVTLRIRPAAPGRVLGRAHLVTLRR